MSDLSQLSDQELTQLFMQASQTAPKSSAPNMARMSYPLMLGGMYGPDIAMGARQVLDAGAEGLASLFGDRQRAAQVNQQALDAYKQKYGEIPGSDVARGIGQGVTTAAALPVRAAGVVGSALQGAGQGAITNALTPAYGVSDQNYAQTKLNQVKEGAQTGAILGGGAAGLGKLFGPTASAEALRAEGVTPTIGQQMGGMFKTLEEKATSLPILGDAIRMAQGAGLDDFNRAIYNRILAPIGITYKGPVGQKGIANVGDKLSQAYDSLLPQMAPSMVDAPFLQGANQLQSMLRSTPQAAQRFNAIYQNEVLNKITEGGTLPPTALKSVEQRLNYFGRNLKASGDPDQRMAGDAVMELMAGLRDMAARSNPDLAPKLQAINKGWAQLVQLENAAKGTAVARREGVVTPANYLKGIQQGDLSQRDRVFTRGQAMNQDLAQAADKTLSNTYPDSGTPGRAILAALTLGGGAYISPPALAGMAAAALPYLPGARRIASSTSGLIGDLAKASPYLGFVAPGLLSSQ